ncbi:MAG TPA: hypothetical protein VGF76_11905 [Polyangiaceae bacterium]
MLDFESSGESSEIGFEAETGLWSDGGGIFGIELGGTMIRSRWVWST